MSKTHILLVEDEAAIAEPLGYLLEVEGFTVTIVGDGLQALQIFRDTNPHLVLLDLMLPGIPGMEVCRQIRATSDTPIIILTAKNSEIDKVLGLELGADDYVTKPYSARELLARINSVLRRAKKRTQEEQVSGADEVIESGPIRLNLSRHYVTINGEEVDLPLKEFELLETLMTNQGHVMTRRRLITLVWGSDYFGDTKTLDVHVKRLRARIEEDPSSPQLIRTVRGVGYRFDHPFAAR